MKMLDLKTAAAELRLPSKGFKEVKVGRKLR